MPNVCLDKDGDCWVRCQGFEKGSVGLYQSVDGRQSRKCMAAQNRMPGVPVAQIRVEKLKVREVVIQ